MIERTSKARELAQEADQLTFALNEIDGVAPEPGEDTAIVAEVRRLSELDSLRSAAEEAHAALAGSDDMASGDVGVMPALDLMSEARARIESSPTQIWTASVPGWPTLLPSSPMLPVT